MAMRRHVLSVEQLSLLQEILTGPQCNKYSP